MTVSTPTEARKEANYNSRFALAEQAVASSRFVTPAPHQRPFFLPFCESQSMVQQTAASVPTT